MKIHDISRKISTKTAPWPGDTPFSFVNMHSMAEGDDYNATAITLSPHLGTHIDAPWHYSPSPLHPDSIPIENCIGPAQVITISGSSPLITVEDIAPRLMPGMTRLVLHTAQSARPDNEWDEDFGGILPEAIDWLADQGIILIGMDMPSIDPPTSANLSSHRIAGSRGIVFIENLSLDEIEDGVYELIALPLKLGEVCASPVRAVLITRD